MSKPKKPAAVVVAREKFDRVLSKLVSTKPMKRGQIVALKKKPGKLISSVS
jgi:hypothetical protein